MEELKEGACAELYRTTSQSIVAFIRDGGKSVTDEMSKAAKQCLELLINVSMGQLCQKHFIPLECLALVSDAKQVWSSGANAAGAALRAFDSVSHMNTTAIEWQALGNDPVARAMAGKDYQVRPLLVSRCTTLVQQADAFKQL